MANNSYKVRQFGEMWGVVLGDDPDARPVGEKLHAQKTNAYRRCRKLNEDMRKIDEMIARNGAIIL